MSTSPNISDALQLERVEFGGWLNDALAESQTKIKALEAEMAARGLRNSGAFHVGEMEIRFSVCETVVGKAIEKRKELGRKFPLLLTKPNLEMLRNRLEEHVDGFAKAQLTRAATQRMGGASAVLNQKAQQNAGALKGKIRQRLEALRLEAGLGMHTEASGVTFNITNSTIASLNLGTVMGDLQSSVQTLNGLGAGELAAVVRTVAETIANSTALRDDSRKELLEHLSFVSSEAALPADKRKTGPLKTSIAALREGLNTASQLATLWPVLEHMLKSAGLMS